MKKFNSEISVGTPKKRSPRKTSSEVAQERSKKQLLADANSCFDVDKMYKGGSDRWLTLILSEDTQTEEHYPSIENEIHNVFGSSVDYFIPVYKQKLGSKEICLVLFEGYVFVQEPKEGFGDIELNRLRTTHIRAPLSHRGSNIYINNKDINNFKKEIKKQIKNSAPKVGAKVIPKEGVFKDLEGTVISVNKDKMVLMVRFETSSRVVEAPVPFINVDYI